LIDNMKYLLNFDYDLDQLMTEIGKLKEMNN